MAGNVKERKIPVIGDRGYPSRDFIKYIQENEIKHVMRVQKRFNSRIDRMQGHRAYRRYPYTDSGVPAYQR
jgi:hypothetical protein